MGLDVGLVIRIFPVVVLTCKSSASGPGAGPAMPKISTSEVLVGSVAVKSMLKILDEEFGVISVTNIDHRVAVAVLSKTGAPAVILARSATNIRSTPVGNAAVPQSPTLKLPACVPPPA